MNNQMPLPEQPQLKMAYYGAQALSNAELLSLVLGRGTKDSIELADKVISYAVEKVGSLGVAEVCELSEVSGIGGAKASAIVAAMELGRREASDAANKCSQRVFDSRQIAEIVRSKYMVPGETREFFVCFCTNTKCQIISEHVISIGSIDFAPAHPREVFGPAVRKGAAAIICAHTHPSSGDPTPSPQDMELTRKLLEASKVLDIQLLDHVVVGDNACTSIKGQWPEEW